MSRAQIRMLVFVIGLLAAARVAHAEPYLALQQGYQCAACHVNPTGGGLRSDFGDVFAENTLPAEHVDAGGQPWLGHVTDSLRMGADLRADWSFVNVPHTGTQKSFALEQFRAYADMALIPGRLDIYADEQLAPGGATAMEAYGRYTGSAGTWYVKGGRFYLPFGWRLQDNTALVREVTGISMTTPDTGVEFGLERPQWSAQLDLTNGPANANSGSGHQVTGQLVWIQPQWRAGIAASATQSTAGNRRLGGIFAGVRTGPVAWLAEGDLVRDDGFPEGTRRLLVSLLEADWALRKGHNLKLTFEYEDPDRHLKNNGETRASLVYEATPVQFLQLRLGYRRFKGIPQSDVQNQSLVFFELHAFL
jgi:hypothetical protein